jgi:hypothetical protein
MVNFSTQSSISTATGLFSQHAKDVSPDSWGAKIAKA